MGDNNGGVPSDPVPLVVEARRIADDAGWSLDAASRRTSTWPPPTNKDRDLPCRRRNCRRARRAPPGAVGPKPSEPMPGGAAAHRPPARAAASGGRRTTRPARASANRRDGLDQAIWLTTQSLSLLHTEGMLTDNEGGVVRNHMLTQYRGDFAERSAARTTPTSWSSCDYFLAADEKMSRPACRGRHHPRYDVQWSLRRREAEHHRCAPPRRIERRRRHRRRPPPYVLFSPPRGPARRRSSCLLVPDLRRAALAPRPVIAGIYRADGSSLTLD